MVRCDREVDITSHDAFRKKCLLYIRLVDEELRIIIVLSYNYIIILLHYFFCDFVFEIFYKKHKTSIIWYNSYYECVKTGIFIRLLDNHLRREYTLHKLFNRNVRLSNISRKT